MDTSAFVMFIYSFIQDFPLNHHPLCILQQLLRWHLHSGNSQTWTQVQIIQCWTVGGYRKPLATVNVAGTGTWCLMPHLYLSVGSMPCCNSDCNTQRITVGHGGNRGQARITKSLLLKKKKKEWEGKKSNHFWLLGYCQRWIENHSLTVSSYRSDSSHHAAKELQSNNFLQNH